MARQRGKFNWKNFLICLACVGIIGVTGISIGTNVKEHLDDNQTNIEQEAPETDTEAQA